MIEQGIVSLLEANVPLAALIDSFIYPVFVPDDAIYPCLSYQVVSAVPSYSFAGSSSSESRIQFDCWGKTYSDAKAIQKALRDALDAFHGLLTDGTKVLGAFRSMEIDFFETDSRIYRAMSEYTFYFVEP